MIAVDSSAVVAIFRGEPEAARLSRALTSTDRRLISAATYVECALVLSSRIKGSADLDQWLAQRSIEIAPVDHTLARLAADAFAASARAAIRPGSTSATASPTRSRPR